MTKYFRVKAKCGHVGKQNYIEKSFETIAESKKGAAKKTRYFPRVKHDLKDAIISVEEITFEEYLQLKEKNNNDPYFHCGNIQSQRMNCIDIDDSVVHFNREEKHYSKKKDSFIKRQKLNKIFSKEFKNIYDEMEGEC